MDTCGIADVAQQGAQGFAPYAVGSLCGWWGFPAASKSWFPPEFILDSSWIPCLIKWNLKVSPCFEAAAPSSPPPSIRDAAPV